MINLVGTSPKTAINSVGLTNYVNHCGLLTSAKSKQNPAYAASVGARWAMDNDAFTGFKSEPFLRYLAQWRYVPGCLFVVAPDVIQDAQKTLAAFWVWQPVIKAFNLPVAFVLQNGMHEYRIPWEYLDAVFIGGSSDFKATSWVAWAVSEAKKRRKWVHNGRVNGKARHQHSIAIGCDSVDGTGYAIEPGRIGRELDWWTVDRGLDVQYTLWHSA